MAIGMRPLITGLGITLVGAVHPFRHFLTGGLPPLSLSTGGTASLPSPTEYSGRESLNKLGIFFLLLGILIG